MKKLFAKLFGYKECVCGEVYYFRPLDAKRLEGYWYNCTCKSTLFWPD